MFIHASQSIDKESLKRFEELSLEYPVGAIIGKAFIVDSIKVNKNFEQNLIKKDNLIYGATVGREGYAFKIENVSKFNIPVKAKGKLGFWNCDKKI